MPFRILKKKILAPSIKKIVVKAPLIARKAKAGQFVILRVDEHGERIPLTLVDWNEKEGTITLIFQEVGVSTLKLGLLEEGDEIHDILGPVGNPGDYVRDQTICVVAGGVGIGAAYPRTKQLKELGNYIVSIIGARSAELLILEEEMKKYSDEIYITTDDGSKGRKGFVTEVLKELLEKGRKFDQVLSIGPPIMMKVTCDVTKPFGVKTIVSLNSMMVCGMGMCGACRVTVGGETKFTCVHGPEFDGHLVDFNELMMRLRMYKEEEQIALEKFKKNILVKSHASG